ncbi:MAG: hypothetical protein KGJ78_10920 [Alphaproteobacteria bacterium]|nr:hypothetical protein [Alphaproteobacteria bacterium]
MTTQNQAIHPATDDHARDAVAAPSSALPDTGRDDDSKMRQWESAMFAEAERHGGVLPPEYKTRFLETMVRLPEAQTPRSGRETEALLNALIEECRFLAHEVAFHSARLTPDPDHRVNFLNAAQGLVRSGAKVGEAIVKLRAAGSAPTAREHRQHMIVEHVQTTRGGGGRARKADSGHQ